jgi:WD40 repeat protein
MKAKSARKASNDKKPDLSEKPSARQIDVHTLQLPFYRVFPIAWVDYHAELKLLAVSRTNSTVEIWTYPYWHLATTIVLQRSLSVRKSFIVEKEGRPSFLLIITANSYVISYDLRNGEFLQHLLHGGDFAFDGDFIPYVEPANEPKSPAISRKQSGQIRKESGMDDELTPTRKSSRMFEESEDILGRLVLACNDGSCRYFEMAQNGLLHLKFTTQGKADPATACCFVKHSPELKFAFCSGYQSGDIRVFDFKTKQQVTLIVGDKSKDQKSTVWSIQTVSPHFVVSGNSQGMVKFHEMRYGTLVKEFREHAGDILAMTVSADGSKVFVSGVDSTIAIFGKHTSEIEGMEMHEFKLNSKDRGQSHDIYALVELHADLLLSAGHSTDMCLYKLEPEGFPDRRLGKGKVKLRHITSVNAGKHIDYCRKSGLLLVNSKHCLDVFTFDPASEEMSIDYLAKITIDEFGIRLFSVSQTASYFCVCSAAKSELFSYCRKRKTLSRISTDFSQLAMKCATFSGQKLYFITEEEPDTLQTYCMATSKLEKHQSSDLARVKNVDIFKTSVNGNKIVAVDKINNTAIAYDLTNKKSLDLSSYRKARVMDATFCTATSYIYLAYETNIILKVNSAGKVVYFSSAKVPAELTKLHDRYFGLASLPECKHKVLLLSLYSFIRLDLKKTYTELNRTEESQVFQSEGIEEPVDQEGQLKIVKTGKPMLGVLFDRQNSMLVVRFDWKTAMSEIPHPVITKKFGQ